MADATSSQPTREVDELKAVLAEVYYQLNGLPEAIRIAQPHQVAAADAIQTLLVEVREALSRHKAPLSVMETVPYSDDHLGIDQPIAGDDVERFWPDEIDMFRELRKSPSRKLIDLARTALAIFEPFREALYRHKASLSVARDDVERTWLEIRENLNRLHGEGAITYGELKHGVNSAAIMRDAALTPYSKQEGKG